MSEYNRVPVFLWIFPQSPDPNSLMWLDKTKPNNNKLINHRQISMAYTNSTWKTPKSGKRKPRPKFSIWCKLFAITCIWSRQTNISSKYNYQPRVNSLCKDINKLSITTKINKNYCQKIKTNRSGIDFDGEPSLIDEPMKKLVIQLIPICKVPPSFHNKRFFSILHAQYPKNPLKNWSLSKKKNLKRSIYKKNRTCHAKALKAYAKARDLSKQAWSDMLCSQAQRFCLSLSSSSLSASSREGWTNKFPLADHERYSLRWLPQTSNELGDTIHLSSQGGNGQYER